MPYRKNSETNFTLFNQKYELQKILVSGLSQLIKRQEKIAKWKSPTNSSASIYFKLLDESLKEYELLFLDILHTYLYGE